MWVENEGIQMKWVVNSQNIHTDLVGLVLDWGFSHPRNSKNMYRYCTTKGPGSSINMKETVMKAQFEYTCSTHGN